MLTAEICVV